MNYKIEKSQKKKMNKKIIIPIATFAALLIMAGAVGITKADYNGNGNDNRGTLVQRLMERFNLNQSEVEEVFNQNRDEMQQRNQANFEERLNQAVSDGKLTDEQKNLILKKKEELQSERESFQNLSFEERKQKMEEHRDEMKKWAEENGIDESNFMFLGGKGGFGGGGRGGYGMGISK